MRKIIACMAGISCMLFCYAQDKNEIPALIGKSKVAKDTALVNALTKIGGIYALLGKADSGFYYAQAALQEAQKIGYQQGMSEAYRTLGNANLMSGKHSEAMDMYLKSLAIKEKIGNKTEMIPLYMNLSTVYLRQKQYSESRQYLNIAWQLAIETKDTVRIVGIQNNYATILVNSNETDSGVYYLKKSVDLSNIIENKPGIDKNQLNHYKMNALLGIAQVLSRQGESGQISKMLDSLWQTEKSGSGITNKLKVLNILTDKEFQDKQYEKAIAYASYAVKLDTAEDNPVLLVGFYGMLSDSYAGLKDYKNAYDNAIRSMNLKDTLYNKEKLSITGELHTRYETEKKDAEILQLGKDKKTQKVIMILISGAAIFALALLILAFRSRKLQKKLFKQKEDLLIKEKEIEKNELQKKMTDLEQMALRAQMNPHFIFNSLNAVQHFVMNRDVEGVNHYLGAFARLVRQTLDNSGKQLITLEEEIRYLDTYLSLEKMKSGNRFSYSINVADNINAGETYIPGMILQPFVENSVLHGVTQKQTQDGQISIRFSNNGNLVCLVEDNGIGRLKAAGLKVTQAGETYESKGMGITMKRIATLNKIFEANITIQVDDITDQQGTITGTTVKLEFPPDLE